MQTKDGLTKGLAIVGTGLLALPLLAPLFFGVLSLVARGRFRLDYLMPAELFPVAILGGGLLLWAALRARAHWRLIGASLAVAVVALFAGQALAVVTGLASGATEPTGWEWAVVLGSLGVYAVALAVAVFGGVLLVRDLFARSEPAVRRPPAAPMDRPA